MRNGRFWAGGSRKLAYLLLALVALPSITLVWLGLRLLDQDRALFSQRELERRQVVGQSAARSLEQSLAATEHLLTGGTPSDGIVRFTITSAGVSAEPRDRVLWLPVLRVMPEAATVPFAEAERLEFRRDAATALGTYRALTASNDPAIRAGALLRVARVHRNGKQWDSALRAYDELAEIRTIAIDGVPADLMARRASVEILAETQRTAESLRHAAAMETDLLSGRWTVDRSAWDLTAADIEHWSGHALRVSPEKKLFSSVAEMLWIQRQTEGERLGTARSVLAIGDASVTVLARTQDLQLTAVAISPAVLGAWARKAVAGSLDARSALSLLSASGQVVAGDRLSGGALRLSMSETGLPWTLALNLGDAPEQDTDLAGRRRLLALGLAAILLLFAGGSYFLWRVVHQELEVARLQTDFVAAVSHEFRTPLTSLRHVTELLAENDEVPRERRRSFYEALGRNTERLQRLVESLLDFARMERGRKPYDLQPVDLGALLIQIVEDFRRDGAARGFDVILKVETPAALRIHGDAPSLTTAVWNLLDNAVKYSPHGHAVHIGLRSCPSGVAIYVRDEGLGVPVQERKVIFERFVRGRKAIQLGIKGTGLGLAMVSHIIQAHGGTVALASEERVGSTFTMSLPLQAPDPGLQAPAVLKRHAQAQSLDPGA